ncbi:MAG: ABC transporter ATP-binding protein, partial [Sedimentibacter sp.]
VILGILKPEAGKILLDNQNISDWSRKNVAQFIGYVPQHHNPPFAYSVFEVVLMGRTPYLNHFEMPSKKDEKIALDAIESMGLIDLKDKSYTNISGGERQLVLIARALTQQPKILIMDEPTSNLDYGNQFKVMNHLKRLTKMGIGIIISTHIPDHAIRYGTKAVLMNKGIISCLGCPEDVINKKNLKDLYNIDSKLINVQIDDNSNFKVCVPY